MLHGHRPDSEAHGLGRLCQTLGRCRYAHHVGVSPLKSTLALTCLHLIVFSLLRAFLSPHPRTALMPTVPLPAAASLCSNGLGHRLFRLNAVNKNVMLL